MSAGPLADGRREVLRRRIRWIVAGTIVYNAVEAVVAIAAGALASSTALVAFGLDSVVEVLSAVAVAWQFSARDPESRERVALRLIAVSFFVLSAYVVAESVARIGESPEPASGTMLVVGVIGLAVNVVSMLLLRSGSTESLNVKGAYYEVVADAAGSVGVILAAILVISGIVSLVRGQILWGVVLVIVGLLVGPGGVSVFG